MSWGGGCWPAGPSSHTHTPYSYLCVLCHGEASLQPDLASCTVAWSAREASQAPRSGGKPGGRGPSRDVRRKAWPQLLVGSWAGRVLGALWVWGQVKFTLCPGAPGWGWHGHVALPGCALGSLPGLRWALWTTAREYYPLAQGAPAMGGPGLSLYQERSEWGRGQLGPMAMVRKGCVWPLGMGLWGWEPTGVPWCPCSPPSRVRRKLQKEKKTGLVSFHLGVLGSRRTGHLPGPAVNRARPALVGEAGPQGPGHRPPPWLLAAAPSSVSRCLETRNPSWGRPLGGSAERGL